MAATTFLLALAIAALAGGARLDGDGSQAWPQLQEQAAGLGAPALQVPEVQSSAVQAPARAAARGGGSGAVMLQGFHWLSWKTSPWWGVIASKARDISASGFDMVWLPPSADAESDEGYIPRRLYLQDSKYGTTVELKRAISALHGGGVKVLADIVVNHRVGTNGWAGFTEPAWGCEAVVSGDEWSGACGNADTGKGVPFARDIDHTQAFVQKDIKAWMNWLKSDIGYDGWRWDLVRGYSPRYLAAYTDAAPPAFAVVEVWDDFDINNIDAHRQKLCDYLDSIGGRASAFDFTTKAVLQQAVVAGEYWRLRDAQGAPPGLIGWWPTKAVTFLDNHDTGASTGGPGQSMWPFPGDRVMEGYAYILTHPGVPCVYWPHFFDWGLHDQIQALIGLRRAAGVTSASQVSVLAADGGRYAAVVDGKLAMKIGPGDWSPGPGWKLAAFGKNYAAWTK
ncbi:MAG: alpha-amylase C-terminal beta-sheet domain-containing protein [Elusimicrobia bacterium]|nr:alpha-amylase C-terminal beta-sheet domain-containing protein [Elusimicrobiota bacterium]